MGRVPVIKKKEFIDLFYEKGLRIKDVATFFNVAESSISQFRKRNRLPLRGIVIPVDRSMSSDHPFRKGLNKGKPAHNKKLPDNFECNNCGRLFKNKTGHQRKFCSNDCYHKHQRKATVAGAFMANDRHPNWVKDRSLVVTQERFSNSQKRKVFNRDKICATCGKDGFLKRDDLQVDHVIPVCLGGKSIISNAQILCKSCHTIKTKKDVLARKLFLTTGLSVSDFFE